MSTKDYVMMAADAIANRPYPMIGTYYVGTVDDLIMCVPKGQEPKGFVLVRKFAAQQLDQGLTPIEWAALEKQLTAHFEREPECQNPPKP